MWLSMRYCNNSEVAGCLAVTYGSECVDPCTVYCIIPADPQSGSSSSSSSISSNSLVLASAVVVVVVTAAAAAVVVVSAAVA